MKWLNAVIQVLGHQWKNVGGYRSPILEWPCGCRATLESVKPCSKFEHEWALMEIAWEFHEYETP